jgi:hypothetical protein
MEFIKFWPKNANLHIFEKNMELPLNLSTVGFNKCV